jgi:hypothetical protein
VKQLPPENTGICQGQRGQKTGKKNIYHTNTTTFFFDSSGPAEFSLVREEGKKTNQEKDTETGAPCCVWFVIKFSRMFHVKHS